MNVEQTIVFGTLGISLFLFVQGRWRYDLVALMALLALSVARIVPPDRAFLGFGHPAVVTVAAVLVISAAMRRAGVIDVLGALLARLGDRQSVQVIALTALVAICSGFMNNVGALAILMPVAIHMARSAGRSPSYLLMPLAFGSLLGGLTTLIGTPPNIIIATYRADTIGEPFGMFDFAWVGAGAALVGVLFIGLIGWRLIPLRKGGGSVEALFEIDKYTAELRVADKSKAAELTIRQVGQAVDGDCAIIGLARGKRRISMPHSNQNLAAGDIILVEGDADSIKSLADEMELELVGDDKLRQELLKSDDVEVMEAIVKPESLAEGRSAGRLNLRRRFGVNLLGVARQGQRLKQRLRDVSFRAGDILLLQGDSQALAQAVSDLSLLPLAVRGIQIGRRPRVLTALGLFAAALVLTTGGWLSVQIALTLCAAAMILVRMLSLREAYQAVDWSVIVLLGAMIPVGEAMESTGGAQWIAEGLRRYAAELPVFVAIGALLIVTALLTDVINNAAAAILMAPIALRLAVSLSASPDPFLMAVAFGASSSFLTPIGHQSNTLVMGPGGYRFGDYWRMGLPLSVMTWGTGLVLILLFWPPLPGVP